MPLPTPPDSLDSTYTFTPSAEAPQDTPTTLLLWESVDQWHQPIERQLERYLTGDDPHAWASLTGACQALEALHEQSREQVDQLLHAASHSPHLVQAYHRVHVSGALAEALVQKCLGTLTDSEYHAIVGCLQPLLDGQEPPQAYKLGRIRLSDSEHQVFWDGALTLTTLMQLSDLSQPPRLLLYRFGVHGGWSAHASADDLQAALHNVLAPSAEQHVTLAAGPWTTFVDTLDAHLAALSAAPEAQPPHTAEAHERRLMEALELLTVPVNPPRLLALARVEETRRSLHLGAQARPWLSNLPADTCLRLAGLVTAYAQAIGDSEQVLQADLPARADYVRSRISEFLTDHFALERPCRVRLTLPVQVDMVRELIAGSGAPGTPSRLVPHPSLDTEQLTLEDLALAQIDDVIAQRLAFAQVHVEPPHHPQAAAITQAVTLAWLQEQIPALDIAGGYERLLLDVYLRAGRFQAHAQDEAILQRPYALMLDIQALIAQHQGRLNDQGVRMVQMAQHATTPAAWRADGLDLALLPLSLTLFNEDTHSAGSTLAGVVLIHDRISKATVLVLPDPPDGKALKQYTSVDLAVEALEDLFVDARLRRYLCERAVEGDPQWLESRINQALITGFRNLINTGAPWPAHQSLVRNQSLAELGLYVRAHRASSTSNADRVFEYARDSQLSVVRYIRLALGVVPFIGSAIAMVDALEAAVEAGRAFAEGDGIAGVEATQSVLLSIADALFDFGPAGLAAASHAASLRATAQARHFRQGLKGAGRLRALSAWSARRADEGFVGYEQAVSLNVQPGSEGRWKGIYRENGGDFIRRGSAVYGVQWDATYHTWRLAPTRTRHYLQPVALDESGQWQTHGHLYGTLVDSGLHGGGGLQSYLADRLDPLWPDTLRRLLPRWWADAHFRRQHQLLGETTACLRRVVENEARGQQALNAFKAQQGSAQAVLDTAQETIDAATALHNSLDHLRRFTRGHRHAEAGLDQSRAAATICAKSHLQINVAHLEAVRLSDLVLEQRTQLEQLIVRLYESMGPAAAVPPELANGMKTIRQTLAQLLEQYDFIERCLERAKTWQRRVTSAEHRRILHTEQEQFLGAFSEKRLGMIRVALLMNLAPADDLTKPSWSYMRRLYGPARERYDRVVQSAFQGESINLRPQQRDRLLRQVREENLAFTRQLRRLTLSYPEQFDPVYTDRLMQALQASRQAAPAQPAQATPLQGRMRPRTFEGDGLLLVGTPVEGQPDRLVINQVNNQAERWARRADRSWAPEAPRPAFLPQRSAAELARHAEERLAQLPAFRQRVRRYTRPDTPAADLEDLFAGEGQELEFHARQLQSADTDQHYTG
ncbi:MULTISPECIES: hypothetical protein [Pseudomonas]|uniref:Uncharacterized protein n=1 Tax=Pseudomonas quercus TaxID=2722792 RepID=A0ABX0YA20_9PSED|nr:MULTISPECIES: hypothetical protein [Pseudomonas]MBF7141616.1 hypothetical protein [Pseudomonas sp. LY10J]NJP00155.1 hypothetical protein [Pseudomonas quercus]